ncbi:kinesin-like protein KIFC3 isoform X2 [Lepisosteus oculatus]|uniref:kinesin-like protein KIFC3 isoform X2 n=1 Tax=Lepisosteus oculatus TaxID=7918 RepID=UPI0035F515DF
MYAFYSLLVYIFYTLFKKEETSQEEAGPVLQGGVPTQTPQAAGSVSMETRSRRRKDGAAPCLQKERGASLTDSDSSISESDSLSLSEEEECCDEGFEGSATSPLDAFLCFRRESEERRDSQTQHERSSITAGESPLLTVMSHLLNFLEQYSHMQRLQERAEQHRLQLRRHRARHRRRLRALRAAYRQRLRDQGSVIGSLEGAIAEQQSLLEATQPRGECVSAPCSGPAMLSPRAQDGLHQLVQSLRRLQGERSSLQGELQSLQRQLEQREKDRQHIAKDFQQEIEDLKQRIEEREEELTRLRTETGVTDSEKRALYLSAENESLKQSLSMTQGLLQQLSLLPAQSSTALIKENESLRSRVQQLESSLQLRAEQLAHLEREAEQTEWRRKEELHRREDRVRELQLELDKERSRGPKIKTVEVDSPGTLRLLAETRERNEHLTEKLSSQNEKYRELEGQLRDSEEISASLQKKIVAYESEIGRLGQQLLTEIGHLEARKEEAVREAAECSEQHLQHLREQFTGISPQHLREQFTGLQSRLSALQPALRAVKANYSSLRSQVRSFSDFYGAAISEAKKQLCSAITEVSEANKDILEKYRKEVALRRKYHEQLVELKGNIRVLCRVKPVLVEDQQEEGQTTVVTTDPNNESAVIVRSKGRERTFELDKVFQPQATQDEVFQEIEPLVTSCIDGYNVCIFAYGQTGSGKTYTMEGSVENPGINQRALKHLFSEIQERKDMWNYTVTLSVMEIYNEVLRDLLSKDPGEKLDIKMNPDGTGQLHVPGLRVIEVKSFQRMRKILALGRKNRITYSTKMNQHSSRSHALLTVTVTGTDLANGAKTTGKLNLVDLAGSERVWKSGAEGERLKEAQNINRSLLALGDVIQALRGKQTHIPFRNSRLTYLLQDSLGKGNKTVMVVQISPLERNVEETMCSLKFAQRVCKVELGPASRKIEPAGHCEFFS